MRSRDGELECRNCGRAYPADRLDRLRWCDLCRGVVVRRATLAGRIAGLVAAIALLVWIIAVVGGSPRFMIAWGILLAAVYYFFFKLTQRVAFEIIRGRGVPPPPE